MKVLHITPSSNGYEEVTLLANRHSPKNHLAVIVKDDEQYMTGGFLLNDTPQIREVLDKIPAEQQYDFVKSFKMDPFVKFYYTDKENKS